MANDAIPYYEPATALTAHVGSTVIGKRFVKISADRQAGPALNNSSTGGNVVIAPCTAAAKAFGVAARDAATGEKVKVFVKNVVVPVKCGATPLAAGVEVESDGTGQAVVLASGKSLGLCIAACAAGADAQILLY
jgi:uncharacterized protein DUF2190